MHYMTAMDPSCEVMLAYKQNGRTLQPDHGYPIRMIIPGYIGMCNVLAFAALGVNSSSLIGIGMRMGALKPMPLHPDAGQPSR